MKSTPMEEEIRKVIREQIKKIKEGKFDPKYGKNGMHVLKFSDTISEKGDPNEFYKEGMSDEEWENAKEAERLAQHPEKDKINKIKKMMDKEKSLKKIAESLGYITIHEDGGLYQEEVANLEDLKSYPFPIGAEITVPALGSAKFANNSETREKTEDPSTRFGIDFYLNEFEKEYGPTEFEVAEDIGKRYTLTPINNLKFDTAYERDRQIQIKRREQGPSYQKRDNMGNYTSKWS